MAKYEIKQKCSLGEIGEVVEIDKPTERQLKLVKPYAAKQAKKLEVATPTKTANK